MSKFRRKAVSLTERDRKLFAFLFESKIANAKQIRQRLFSTVTKRMANRRLAQLTNSGWIRKLSYVPGPQPVIAFSVSERAYREYLLEPGSNDHRKQLKSEVKEHDIALVDIRQRFEKAESTIRYLPENVLQSSQEKARSSEFRDFVALRSDAVIELNLHGDRFLVPIEYEASHKSLDRSRQKLLNYYVRCDSDAVFWICGDEAIRERMAKLDREIGKDSAPKAYFALLSDVLSDLTNVTFTNVEGKKLIIN